MGRLAGPFVLAAIFCTLCSPSLEAQTPPAATTARPTSATLDPRPIEAALATLATQTRSWGGTLGALVVDAETGSVLAKHDEAALMNPASNAKLATAAAALARLGGSRRLLTGLYGSPRGDHLDTLVLRSEGDPSLSTTDLWSLARALRGKGIRRVGAIEVDQSAFDDRFVPPAFEQQPNEWAPFRAPVSAVSLDANTVRVEVNATETGKPATVGVDPAGFVQIRGAVRTLPKASAEAVTLDLSPAPTGLVAKISGGVPEGHVVRFVRRVDDPRLLAGYALREVLRQVGIEAPGEVRVGGAGEKNLLVSHASAPLAELLHHLGKDSDNFYAETIFKLLGAESSRPATAVSGAEAVVATLRALGADEKGATVANGSGLFDANRMSARQTVKLLRAASTDPSTGPEFLSHLAIGGVDGTLRSRFRGLPSRVVRAKTGTLRAVAALSGFVIGPNGRPRIVFAIFANGIPNKPVEARPLMDAVVQAAARQVWKDQVP